MAESSLAGTNNQQAAHVDGLGIERFQSGDHQILTFATHVAAYDDRRIWSTKLEQEIVRSDDLLAPATRGRVVDGQHQISLNRSTQSPLDH
jgi:hypothetical protein